MHKGDENMAISVSVVDGEIQETASSSSSLSNTGSTGGTLGKDAFLQLLVTQMKYQDPLSPTDNTEYISQLATFSQLEEMQNMSNTLQISQASSLTGETVIMKTKSSVTGELTYVTGTVDYVVVESSKAYLCINGSKYSIDDLDTVIDADYWEEYKKSLTSGDTSNTTTGSSSSTGSSTTTGSSSSTGSDSATENSSSTGSDSTTGNSSSTGDSNSSNSSTDGTI